MKESKLTQKIYDNPNTYIYIGDIMKKYRRDTRTSRKFRFGDSKTNAYMAGGSKNGS